MKIEYFVVEFLRIVSFVEFWFSSSKWYHEYLIWTRIIRFLIFFFKFWLNRFHELLKNCSISPFSLKSTQISNKWTFLRFSKNDKLQKWFDTFQITYLQFLHFSGLQDLKWICFKILFFLSGFSKSGYCPVYFNRVLFIFRVAYFISLFELGGVILTFLPKLIDLAGFRALWVRE